MTKRFSRLYAFIILSFLIFFTHFGPAFAETISEDWMEVLMLGKKIGFTYQKVEKIVTGYKLTSKTVIRLEIQGITQDISSSQTYYLDENLKPKRFSYIQKMLNHRQFFDGHIKDGKLMLTARSGGNVTRRELPFDHQTYLADAMNFLLGKKKLRTGDTYTYKVFLIPILAKGTVKIRVGKKLPFKHDGRKEEVFAVTSTFENFTVTSYVTPDGRVLKEESPLGFVSLAVDETRAVSFPEGVLPFTNLLTFSLIPIDEPLEKPETIKRLNVRVAGLSRKDLIPNDQRQKVKVQEKRINGEKVSYLLDVEINKTDGKSLPSVSRPLPARGMEKHLKPTFEAQSDDPDIIRQARKIVGAEKSAYKSAALINRWVYKNLEKKFIDTFSAVETLKTLEGECQSHTNLFTALARASGIPTRTVSGIVYSEQFNGFLYHAWPEVYVGKWVAMDPTFGQEIADATHIKLVEGDLSQQLQLFEFIGKIGIDINSIERY